MLNLEILIWLWFGKGFNSRGDGRSENTFFLSYVLFYYLLLRQSFLLYLHSYIIRNHHLFNDIYCQTFLRIQIPIKSCLSISTIHNNLTECISGTGFNPNWNLNIFSKCIKSAQKIISDLREQLGIFHIND